MYVLENQDELHPGDILDVNFGEAKPSAEAKLYRCTVIGIRYARESKYGLPAPYENRVMVGWRAHEIWPSQSWPLRNDYDTKPYNNCQGRYLPNDGFIRYALIGSGSYIERLEKGTSVSNPSALIRGPLKVITPLDVKVGDTVAFAITNTVRYLCIEDIEEDESNNKDETMVKLVGTVFDEYSIGRSVSLNAKKQLLLISRNA